MLRWARTGSIWKRLINPETEGGNSEPEERAAIHLLSPQLYLQKIAIQGVSIHIVAYS